MNQNNGLVKKIAKPIGNIFMPFFANSTFSRRGDEIDSVDRAFFAGVGSAFQLYCIFSQFGSNPNKLTLIPLLTNGISAIYEMFRKPKKENSSLEEGIITYCQERGHGKEIAQQTFDVIDSEELFEFNHELVDKILNGESIKPQESINEEIETPIVQPIPFDLANSKINKFDYIQIPTTGKVISRFELPECRNLTWKKAHFKLQENGLYMPVVPLFMTHFMNVLNSYNSKGKNPLFDAAGNPISERETNDIYLYLMEGHTSAYGSWIRSLTWLDTFFKKEKGIVKLFSEHKIITTPSGKRILTPTKIENLESCLNKWGYVNLKFNEQGFPTSASKFQEAVPGKNIYFAPPKNKGVTFFAGSYIPVGLHCYGGPSSAYGSTEVFAVAQGEQ